MGRTGRVGRTIIHSDDHFGHSTSLFFIHFLLGDCSLVVTDSVFFVVFGVFIVVVETSAVHSDLFFLFVGCVGRGVGRGSGCCVRMR